MNDPSPKRRSLRFWLLVASVAAWVLLVVGVASELKFIHERRAARHWLGANGGFVISRTSAIEQGLEGYCPKSEIAFWRRWLGDETAGIVAIGPHATQPDKERIARLFAETRVLEAVRNSP